MAPFDPRQVEAELAAYYDAEGDERLRRPVEPDRLAARGRFVESLSGRLRSVLEIGSGPGRDAAAFLAAGHRYTAVDLSVEHARRCRATASAVAVASVRQLPFRTASFDAIWTMSTLMHVPDVAIGGALAEVARVLKPGAVAAIGVWGGPDIEERMSKGERVRLFSRRSNERWTAMLAGIGTVERFDTWDPDDDPDFFYQFAVVRAGSAR